MLRDARTSRRFDQRLPIACVTLIMALLGPFALSACNGSLSGELAGVKNELNLNTEIENFIVSFADTVNIGDESHAVSADTAQFCPNAPEPQLKVLGFAKQVDPDNDSSRLRKRPGTDAGELAAIPTGDRVYVFFGPVCVEGYNWYTVAIEDYVVGWVAEADKETKTRWFEPDIRNSN